MQCETPTSTEPEATKPATADRDGQPQEPTSQPTATDPLIANMHALVEALAAACKAEESDEPDIPADVPRFESGYPWAS